jgi:hypothetical protein
MADNLKRQRRDIPFVGGVLSDPVSQQTPVHYLENLLNHSSSGDGLTPRNGIEPFTALPTEETEGCVLFLVTLQDAPRTQLVVMMNADTKRVIHIDDYIEQEGRRAAPPSGGDYPAPIPIPSSNGLEFVTATSRATLGEEVSVSVAGLESGGTCNWVALFSDDSSFYELDNGTVTASGSSSGTISFELPSSADGAWSVTVYLYNPAGEVGLFHTTLHTITEAVDGGLWNPIIISTYETEINACNFYNKDTNQFKGLLLEPTIANASTYVRSWRCYNTPDGYMLAVLRYSDSSGVKFYVDVYTMDVISAAPNNATIQATYTFNVDNADEVEGNDSVTLAYGQFNTELGVSYVGENEFKVRYYDIKTGASGGSKTVAGSTSAFDRKDMGGVWGQMFRWDYAIATTPQLLDLRGALIPSIRTLNSGIHYIKQIDPLSGDSGNYVYNSTGVQYYNHVNDTYGSQINFPAGINLGDLAVSQQFEYENRNVLYDGTDVIYALSDDNSYKILFLNVLGNNVRHDTVPYRWVDLSSGFMSPVMLGFSDNGSKFYAVERSGSNINLFIYDLVNKTSSAIPVIGGTTPEFSNITTGGVNFSYMYNFLPPAQYGNWII